MEDKSKTDATGRTNFILQVGNAIANFESSKLSDLSSVRNKTSELLGTLGAIKEEMQAASQLKDSQQGAYQRLLETIEKLRAEIGVKYFGLLPEDVALMDGMLQEIQRKKKEAQLREEAVPTPE